MLRLVGLSFCSEMGIAMLGWLKRKSQMAIANSASEDLQRFILSLKGASDEQIGLMVAIATTIRMNFEAMGKLPRGLFDLSVPRDADTDRTCDIAQLFLSNAVKQFQQMNLPSDAVGVMIWLHSARALNIPEVRYLGRQMWQELQRGFPHALGAMWEIDDLKGTSRSDDVGSQLYFVPVGLE